MKNRAIHLERRRGSEEIPEMTKRWFAGPSFDALDDSDRKNDAKKTVKELEDENRRLKKMYAEERLKSEVIQEAMAKKW